MIYYNDNNRECAAWLAELMEMDLIRNGHIDERDVKDVKASDVEGFDQCHWFAGIGGWSLAFELAGWDSARSVWSASLPCQPFSVAGQGKRERDERHLWPAFHDLIKECRPTVLVGEQSASTDGRIWLSAVFADLEDLGYACAGADLCAAGIGAPHIRQRLYWLAYLSGERLEGFEPEQARSVFGQSEPKINDDGMGVTNGDGCQPRRASAKGTRFRNTVESAGWSDCAWIECREPRGIVRRPLEPRLAAMVDGIPACLVRGGNQGAPQAPRQTAEARKMRIQGYGNAIVPQLAAIFLQSASDTLDNLKKIS